MKKHLIIIIIVIIKIPQFKIDNNELTSKSQGSNNGVRVSCMTVFVENSIRGLIP